MPTQFSEMKTFKGLYLQPNSFTVPDGAMEVARNCILYQDNRISKTRGFYEYFDPNDVGTLNNLFFYQNKLLAIYLDKLVYYTDTGSYPNYTGVESTLSGATVAISSPRTSRSVQASNNLYMTTDNGVIKLDAYNAKIFAAGVPPGLDISAILLSDNGWFTGDSQVAVRVLFGRRDANANVLLGAPSEQLVLSNPPVANVTYTVSGGPSPYVITVTSTNHNLSSGMTISVTASTGSPVVPVADYTVTVVDANSFTFLVPGSAPGAGNLTYKVSRIIQLEFSIPTEITNASDQYFFRYYRTSTSLSSAVTPTPNYRLVEERILTSAEISAGRVFYTDDIDDVLVSLAPELYTNPNSQEGESQANAQPPKCDDMTLFKDCVLYAKCTTRHFIEVDVIDTATLSNNDYVEIKLGLTTRRYVARTGVANTNVAAQSLSYSTPTLTITYANHGLQAGDSVYISNAVGTGTLPSGSYAISNVLTNSFEITQVGITGISYLEFEGTTVTGGYYMFALDKTSASIAAQLRNTARGLVKAVNRDTGSLIYASYTSAINDVPGKMGFRAKGFGDPMYFRANTTTAGSSFLPALPNSFVTGNQVFSANENKPNSIYCSKIGEPEAVPVENEFVAGSRNAQIYRIFALRDSVIILKADGVFRLTGDNPLNFNITAIDNTIFTVSANSGAILNNQVYFLANQGVCLANESSTQILSRQKVEDVIIPIVGKDDINIETGAVSYESERTYKLSTIGPNADEKTVSYIYNFVNDTWTTFDELFIQGIVGPNDTQYLITVDNRIKKERKTQTRIDYCGQNYGITITSVSVDKMSAIISSPNIVPAEGDVILKSDVFSRIKTVVANGGSSYTLTFRTASNLSASDSLNLYQGYVTEINFAPFHAGQVGLMKQFSQMQIHTRSPQITRLEINYSGYSFGGSETTIWEVQTLRDAGNLGWGQFPWGFEPWGQADAINTPQGTQPAPPIRTIIPLFQQRNTYIKTRFIHREAGESMDIQALDFAVRPYKERVSR